MLYRVPYLKNVIITILTLNPWVLRGWKYVSCTLLNMAMMSSTQGLVMYFLMSLAKRTKLLRLTVDLRSWLLFMDRDATVCMTHRSPLCNTSMLAMSSHTRPTLTSRHSRWSCTMFTAYTLSCVYLDITISLQTF